MNTKATLAVLSMSVLLALGTGCDREEPLDEGVGTEVAVEGSDDDLVEPIVGADPVGEGLLDADRDDFGTWDANADGFLDENEFRTRFSDGQLYGDWDSDRDRNISTAEWGTVNTTWGDAPGGVDTNGLFDTWDADEDGLIDNNEMSTGVYDTWDVDDNNMVDTNEFNDGVVWFGW